MADTHICSVEGCEKPSYQTGLCSMHYSRVQRTGTTELRPKVIHKCLVEGCDRMAEKRGWCEKHYLRWWKTGTLITTKTEHGALAAFMDNVVLKYTGDDCLIWPFHRNEHGYGELTYDGVEQKASRLACTLAHGEPPTPQHQATHECGNGHLGCVTPGHLSWKTPKGNADDRLIHGTDGRGEKHSQHKLTWADVEEIRASDEIHRVLAARYGVCRATIGDIKARRSWDYSHLNPRRSRDAN